jgi:hypothetical protein
MQSASESIGIESGINQIIVWERLTLFRFVLSVFKQIINPGLNVHYVVITPFARKLMNFLNFRALNTKLFIKIDLGGISRKDHSGNAIIYKTEELTWRVVEDYLADKTLSVKAYQSEEDCWRRIVHSWYLIKIKGKTELLFLLKNYLIEFYPEVEKKIVFDSFPLYKNWLKTMPVSNSLKLYQWPNAVLIFFPILSIGKVILSWLHAYIMLIPPKTNIQLSDRRPRIFEEYEPNIFSRYPIAGHLFWYPSSGISPERVVLYFDRSDTHCCQESIEDVEKNKFTWLDMLKISQFPLSGKVLLAVAISVILPKRINKELLYLYGLQIYLIFIVEWYRNIIRKYNVRVVHQHHECSPLSLSLALATRLEGGIFVWNHWSIDHYPISYFNTGFADLVFSWGEYNDGYFNCQNFKYRYILQTGLIAGDAYESSDKKIGRKLRNEFPEKVDFVVAIFDTSHQLDSICVSTEMVIEFYKNILNLIVENENWGVIIKSKGVSFQRIETQEVIQKPLRKLFSGKRCVISKLNSRVIPASIAADISLCYEINSAGIIAGLAGQQVIHLDRSGGLKHPLYQLNLNKNIIFQSYEEIKKNLESFENGNSEIGNHQKCLSLMDPYRDGRGPERAGEVIAAFLDGLDAGKTRDQALKDAVAGFARKWGQDKVTVFGQRKDHEGNRVWEKVRDSVKQSLREELN